ncbi:peptidoglycan-binding protein [Rhodobacterales bacterium HKCCE2091]|nr:peptidoglycan-binding protein [Rhodobacterales bacterium HKCCE2091]
MVRAGLQMVAAALVVVTFAVTGALAQARHYVQIEAHPDLATAEQRVRAYARLIDNVSGFRLSSGWYAVAIGPLDPTTANQQLLALSAQGLVPRDAYVENRDIYEQRFFPAGGDIAPVETPAIEAQPLDGAAGDTETAEVAPIAPPPPPEETPQEARQSEAQLDLAQRQELQIALEWFGFYNSGIDGAFGPGTRAAMQAWQADRGHEATGILTTRQRTELLDGYRGELAALGMQFVTDARAGIELEMPMAMVEFDRYEFPFAHYTPINDSGVRVLLISQEGSARTLAGLYEIMQTLEIVPLEGERSRDANGFVLTGQSPTLRSHTVARLQDGAIKGFTLIWPPERDAQMARVLPMMLESMTFLPGTLDPGAVSEAVEDVDLVSGLEVRRPEITRSGFYADAAGTVVTTTEVTGAQCTRLLIDGVYEADVAFRDDALGLAVLTPRQPLAPVAHADFATGPARPRSQVAVAGFPYDGALGAASLSFGELSDVTGLDGDSRLRRLSVEFEPSEAGAAVLDATGAVIGMILPEAEDGARELPAGVAFALSAEEVFRTLAEQGLGQGFTPVADTAAPRAAMNRDALARLGADMAVTVSCWN